MTPLELLLDGIALVELLASGAVAALLLARWRRLPSRATASALAVFAVVALVVLSGFAEPPERPVGLLAVLLDVQVVLLLSLAWLLARLTWSLGGLRDTTYRVLTAVMAAETVLTFAVPPLPPEGAPRPGWAQAYVGVVLLAFAVQSGAAAAGLWRAGRGQSAVVRERMRLLSTGAVVLAATLVLIGTVGEAPVLQVTVGLLGLASVLLFALAFLLPGWLRLVLRQRDLVALAAGERHLMTAVHRDEIGRTVVTLLASVLGGGGAGLFDVDRAEAVTQGWDDDQAEQVGRLTRHRPAEPALQELAPGVLGVRLHRGWLVVQAGPLAPVFGNDESVLLTRVGTLVDLALQRAALFSQERASREAAERASAELETLLYSVSHDLRSPLISVLGYLDVLREEHADELGEQGTHYLGRISVNALYMQNLIADLLELSRIGRNDQPARPVDLHALAEEVLHAAALGHPAARLDVVGRLPAVCINDVRARQLLTNLVDNALTHGGRPDLQVRVAAGRGPDGEVRLTVTDDGRGVPEEYRVRVLQVFERLDAPKSTPGTGMGLAICKRIAESLGGQLRVEGPPPDAPSGTTVVVALPAQVLEAPALPSQRSTSSATAADLAAGATTKDPT